MKRNDPTLWGPAQTVDELVPGIFHVTTAGHGGIYVIPEKWRTMPEFMQGTPYSERGFFEEDLDWCLPFIVFESELKQSSNDRVRRTIETGAHREAFAYDYHKNRAAQWAHHRGAGR